MPVLPSIEAFLAIALVAIGLSFVIVGPGNRVAWIGICAAVLAAYVALSLLGAPPFHRTTEHQLPAYKKAFQLGAGVVGLGMVLLPVWAAFFRRWRNRQ